MPMPTSWHATTAIPISSHLAGITALIGSKAYRGGEIDWDAGHVYLLNFALGLAKAADMQGLISMSVPRFTALPKAAPTRSEPAKAGCLPII